MDIGTVIAMCSVAVALVFQGLTAIRTGKRDKAEESSQMTLMFAKLDEVQRGIDDIRSEIAGIKSDVREDHDNLIRLEQSVKTLWHKVNGPEERAERSKE